MEDGPVIAQAPQPTSTQCQHSRTKVNARTWIRTCLDCGAWKCDDECDDVPLGGWRERDGWRRI